MLTFILIKAQGEDGNTLLIEHGEQHVRSDRGSIEIVRS